ncbi:uncharacterized protein LOC108914495 [Anoplophora glabripennis]|uniref:uncharacterized protein LOC108914495 n=1 Tax=Anoplophora glabripennis TaxID=217634 RepID=UPI000873CD55|nr:uncharacterized protein LOC108914495 [Anoplophora glabripennis]
MTQKLENKLEIWERKMLRRIFGGIKLQNEFRRTNKEIMELYGKPDIVQVVKAQRARWLGHIARMSNERWVKNTYERRRKNEKRTTEEEMVGRSDIRSEENRSEGLEEGCVRSKKMEKKSERTRSQGPVGL